MNVSLWTSCTCSILPWPDKRVLSFTRGVTTVVNSRVGIGE